MQISILIPCFNAEQWIAQAIQSGLDQTYPEKEVIVVDDGSTDGSLKIIRSFGDRIRWESGPNGGGNIARNRLLDLSAGDWLQYLDADDYLLPGKLERQLTHLKEHPELDVIYSPVIIRRESSGEEEILEIAEKADPFVNYFRWSAFSTHSLLLRKDAVANVGKWNESQPCCQEHELILRLMIAGKRFGLFDEAHAVYRFHSASTVSTRLPEHVVRLRMEMTDRLEEHLAQRGLLTERRQEVLRQVRFDTARSIYRWNPEFAARLMTKAGGCIRETSLGYRLVFAVAGFNGAEQVASVRRKFLRRFAT